MNKNTGTYMNTNQKMSTRTQSSIAANPAMGYGAADSAVIRAPRRRQEPQDAGVAAKFKFFACELTGLLFIAADDSVYLYGSRFACETGGSGSCLQ